MSNKGNSSLTYIDLERLVLFIVLLILAYRFIQLTAEVLILFALVFLIVLLLNPLVVWIEKKGLKRSLSAILSVLFVLLVIAIILAFALPPIIIQINLLIKDIPQITDSLLDQIQRFSKQFPFLKRITSQLDIGKILTAGPVFTKVAKISQNFVAFLFFVVLAVFLIIFVLSNPKPLLAAFFQFFSQGKINRIRESIILLSQGLATWFYSSLAIGVINGMVAGVGLLIIGVKFALIFAVLLVLAEFVPLVGPLAVAIIAILFALSQSLVTALLAIGVFIVVQVLEATIWSPLILAHRLELHPISVVFGILTAEAILGLAGALLAVPILLTIKIFYYEFFEKEFPAGFLETEAEEVMEMELKHREKRHGS